MTRIIPVAAIRARAGPGARRLRQRLGDTLLEIEGAMGVLGPAHRRWRDNTAEVNRRRWNEWDWSAGGEEWTESEEWKRGLVDEVLIPAIPRGGTVLEIGPGAGRWTVFLAPRCEQLILVDVAEKPLEEVTARLAGAAEVRCLVSDGASLAGVEDGSVDAV